MDDMTTTTTTAHPTWCCQRSWCRRVYPMSVTTCGVCERAEGMLHTALGVIGSDLIPAGARNGPVLGTAYVGAKMQVYDANTIIIHLDQERGLDGRPGGGFIHFEEAYQVKDHAFPLSESADVTIRAVTADSITLLYGDTEHTDEPFYFKPQVATEHRRDHFPYQPISLAHLSKRDPTRKDVRFLEDGRHVVTLYDITSYDELVAQAAAFDVTYMSRARYVDGENIEHHVTSSFFDDLRLGTTFDLNVTSEPMDQPPLEDIAEDVNMNFDDVDIDRLLDETAREDADALATDVESHIASYPDLEPYRRYIRPDVVDTHNMQSSVILDRMLVLDPEFIEAVERGNTVESQRLATMYDNRRTMVDHGFETHDLRFMARPSSYKIARQRTTRRERTPNPPSRQNPGRSARNPTVIETNLFETPPITAVPTYQIPPAPAPPPPRRQTSKSKKKSSSNSISTAELRDMFALKFPLYPWMPPVNQIMTYPSSMNRTATQDDLPLSIRSFLDSLDAQQPGKQRFTQQYSVYEKRKNNGEYGFHRDFSEFKCGNQQMFTNLIGANTEMSKERRRTDANYKGEGEALGRYMVGALMIDPRLRDPRSINYWVRWFSDPATRDERAAEWIQVASSNLAYLREQLRQLRFPSWEESTVPLYKQLQDMVDNASALEVNNRSWVKTVVETPAMPLDPYLTTEPPPWAQGEQPVPDGFDYMQFLTETGAMPLGE